MIPTFKSLPPFWGKPSFLRNIKNFALALSCARAHKKHTLFHSFIITSAKRHFWQSTMVGVPEKFFELTLTETLQWFFEGDFSY